MRHKEKISGVTRDALVLGASILAVVGFAILMTKDYVRVEESGSEAAKRVEFLPPVTDLAAIRTTQYRMDLAWSYGERGQSGFEIERGAGDSCAISFRKIASVGVNALKYANTGLDAGTFYCYRIRAYAGSGSKRVYSDYSNIADPHGVIVSPPVPSPTPVPPPVEPSPEPTSPRATVSLSLSNEGARIVNRGSSVTNVVNLEVTGESSGLIGFTAIGLPDGASATFTPATCTASCTTTLSLTTALTKAGVYPINIVASGGGQSANTQFPLTVQASGGYRNILIEFYQPVEAIRPGSELKFHVLSQNPAQPGVHFYGQLLNPQNQVVQSGIQELGADGTKDVFVTIPSGHSAGYWGYEVWFMGEGYYNDGDRVSFPVSN